MSKPEIPEFPPPRVVKDGEPPGYAWECLIILLLLFGILMLIGEGIG